MPYYNEVNRRRSQARPRENPQAGGDAIAIALTTQVVICIILLLALGVTKRSNLPLYDSVKQQYVSLVSDTSQNTQTLESLSQSGETVQGIFANIEEFLRGFFAKFSKQPQPEVQAAAPDSSQSQPEVEAIAPDSSQSQPASAFSYDYLEKLDTQVLGRGGMQPIATVQRGYKMLEAPNGSTLSLVVLGGKIYPPVTGIITSDFAFRYHPVTNNEDFHNGIDIAAEEGRDILAALPGEVVEVGESQIYGLYIVLQHATNLKTFYAHCSEIIAEEGMKIRQGERIAKVGQTGIATGPHLHFSVIVEDTYTDPAWVLGESIQLVG